MSKIENKRGSSEPRSAYTKEELEEIDRVAAEAYENGELQASDVLGNTEVIQPILDELFTGDEKPLDAYRVLGVVKHLQGRVLTVVDATFTDEKRIKYVKDLVKECFSASSNWLYEMSIREFEEMDNHKSKVVTEK